MSLSRFKAVLVALGVGALAAVAVSGFGQTAGPPPDPGAPPRVNQPAPGGGRATIYPKFTRPLWAKAQAYVKLEDPDTLRVRAEIPMFGFVKLLDADNQPVSVHRFHPWQPPPFTAPAKEVRVFDTRGREKPREDWPKLFREETLVLLEFAPAPKPEEFADTFRLFRGDVLVVVLPAETFIRLDPSKAFPPVKSLPQHFPGQSPAPGGPIPPRGGS